MSWRTHLIAFIALCMASCMLTAEEWTSWRGPKADGTWHAPKLPAQWPAKGLKRLWKQPIGGGYAGIAVQGDRIFTMDLETLPRAQHTNDVDCHERILCRHALTGTLLWQHRYPVKYGDLGGYANGPRAMPTVANGNLFTLGAVGHVHCLDVVTGKPMWTRDLVREANAKIPMWGYAASPVVDGNRVILHVGAEPNGCLLALHRDDGRELWRSLADPAGYCTPIFIDAPSGRQLVAWTPENVHGVATKDGKPMWSVPYKVTYGVSIATPIYKDGILFVSGYWEGSKAIQLGGKPDEAKVIWEDNKVLRGLMAQPLYRDGHVYLLDKSIGLTCFELKTGRKVWDDGHRSTPRARNPHASIVWINDGDRALLLNAMGELILARLSPSGYQEETRTAIVQGEVWAHPGLGRDKLYVRTDGAERWQAGGPYELVCISLVQEAE